MLPQRVIADPLGVTSKSFGQPWRTTGIAMHHAPRPPFHVPVVTRGMFAAAGVLFIMRQSATRNPRKGRNAPAAADKGGVELTIEHTPTSRDGAHPLTLLNPIALGLGPGEGGCKGPLGRGEIVSYYLVGTLSVPDRMSQEVCSLYAHVPMARI